MQRTHREVVIIPAVIHLQLLCEILKGVKTVSGVEPFVVLPVAALHFAVMPRRVRADELMGDAVPLQMLLEQRGLIPVSRETVRELRPVICLDTLDTAGECLYQVFEEPGGGISALLSKGFHKAPAGIFIDRGILIEMLPFCSVHKTYGGYKLNIHLDTLSGIEHLFIRLGDVLGVGRLDGHESLPFEDTVKSGDRTGVAALHELYPKDDETGMRVAPAQVRDEAEFISGMLARVAQRPSGAFPEGLDGAVKAAFPAVDILSVGLIFDSRLGDTIFFSVSDEG